MKCRNADNEDRLALAATVATSAAARHASATWFPVDSLGCLVHTRTQDWRTQWTLASAPLKSWKLVKVKLAAVNQLDKSCVAEQRTVHREAVQRDGLASFGPRIPNRACSAFVKASCVFMKQL